MFKVGDKVKTNCKCNNFWCKPSHNRYGFIVGKTNDRRYQIQVVGQRDFLVYREHKLIPIIKQVIKNELKGLLE